MAELFWLSDRQWAAIERPFCRLKDWRGSATRYDRRYVFAATPRRAHDLRERIWP